MKTDEELRCERDASAEALSRETNPVKRRYWQHRFQAADTELRDRYWANLRDNGAWLRGWEARING
jgi:hypothetical protein